MRVLLSHEKEWNWVICRDVDGPKEWSKSEREKQILYISASRKMVQMAQFAGPADVENGRVDK